MALLQAVTIALIALILVPGFSFYFDIVPKLVVLLAGTAIAVVFTRSISFRGSGRRLFLFFTALLVLTVASLAISTAISAHTGLSLFGTNWRRFGAIIQATILLFAWLVSVVCAGRPERVRTILRGISVAGAISAVYGIAQYFGWDPFLPAAAYHVGEGSTTIVRAPGTLGYASYFATWLLMTIFLAGAQVRMESYAMWRRFAFLTMPVAAFCMYLTGTRAAIVGLAVGALVWIWMQRPRVTSRAWLAAALAFAALAGFYYSPAGLQMRSRARWFAEDPWGGARGKLWRDSLRMAVDKPLLGYGPEVFTGEFPRYESASLAQAYPDFSHESPHNIFLDSFVSHGIPGLLLTLAFCVIPFTTTRHAELSAALAAGIVSQQFTSFTVPTAVQFYVVLGVFVALESSPVETRRRLPVTAAGAVLSGCLLFLGFRFAAADHSLQLTKQALDRNNLAAAVANYGGYEKSRLPGGTADIWYSRSLLALASRASDPRTRTEAFLRSLAAGEQATLTAEDPFNAWYNAAVIFGLRNDGVHAEQCVRAAVAAHPNWFKPHWILAQILVLTGRAEEAQREAALAAELDGGKNQEVVRTLQEIRNRRSPGQFPPLQR